MYFTKERILTAFNTLIEKYEYNNITVTMIVKEAGISRATFYRCFQDKSDVVNYNFSHLVESSLKEKEIRTIEDLFVVILEKGRLVWQPLLPLFSTEGANSLNRFICEYSYRIAASIYERENIHSEGTRIRRMKPKENLQLRIFCYGCAGFFEDWIRGVYPLSSAEAAAALCEQLPSFIRRLKIPKQ